MAIRKMSTEKMAEHQANIDDVRKTLERAIESLDCAESCETVEDFEANVASALCELIDAKHELTVMK